MNPTVPKFIQNIDFKLLKEQKNDLLQSIQDFEMEAHSCENDGHPKAAIRLKEQAESIQGIINLIDSIQDYAVDELGKSETDVFDL